MSLELKIAQKGEVLRRDIISQIKKGTLKRNDRILPEEKLAEVYRLGIKIVRKTLEELERDGVIYRRKGVGTFANGLLTGTFDIAVLVFDMYDISNVYCRELFKGIRDAAEKNSCSFHVHPLNSRKIRGSNSGLLRDLISSGKINGILFLSCVDMDEIEFLRSERVPFVTAGFEYRGIDGGVVVFDLERTVTEMLEFLFKNSRRKIGIITGEVGINNLDVIMGQEKIKAGVEEFFKRKGPTCSHIHKKGFYTPADGYRLVSEILDENPGTQAIVSFGNELTSGAFEALKVRGRENDIVLMPIVEDPLDLPRPLVLNPVYRIGVESVETLLRLAKGGGPERIALAPGFLI